MALYATPKSEILWHGKKYRLNLSVSRVLKSIEILTAQEICEVDKVRTVLSLLVKGSSPQDLSFLDAVFSVLKKGDSQKGKKQFDFFQDEALIYSAFLQVYQIDLHKESKKMHWFDFINLLNGLPKGTRFSDVIEIREADVPKLNSRNAESVRKLQELKSRFALKTPLANTPEDISKGLETLYATLAQQAEVNKCRTLAK